MATKHRPDEWIQKPLQRLNLPSRSYIIGIGILGGIGFSTLWIHLFHLITRSERLYTRLLGTFLPLGLSLVLLGLGVWIHWHQSKHLVIRVGAWCFVGSVVLIGVSVTSIIYQMAKDVVMTDPLFVITNHATVGAVLGTLMGIYDGQRHKRGSELRTERKRVQRLNKQLTVLNRMLRHDIRNHINVILGNTGLIRQGTDDIETVTETISQKASDLQAMSERARQLTQLFKDESIQTKEIDILPILEAKVIKFSSRDSAIDIETEFSDDLVVDTSTLFEEAIDELLNNAIEHNDTDTPRLTITAKRTHRSSPAHRQIDGEQPVVMIRISDNGPGIPENVIEVFERGYETDLKHLNGLGLWFVYWVIELSNGEIRFKENHPRGSIVELRLPATTEYP